MKLRILGAADVVRALPMAEAIETSREAFAALSAGKVDAPPRTRLAEAEGSTLLMGAVSAEAGRIAKVVSVFPHNVRRSLPTLHGLVLVIDPETGQVAGLCEGAALTTLRTGAASGLATSLLARPESAVAAVLGAGEQARAQVLAITAVRPLREVRVYARDRARLRAFCAALQPQVEAQLRPMGSSVAAIDGADVVCAATSSPTPVLDGNSLMSGAHVNGVGSFRSDMRELDERTIARANCIVVDQREAALAEAGELASAVAAGVTQPEDWVELGQLVAEQSGGRVGSQNISVFKSVGHAAQDLFAARRAIANADRLGLGQSVDV